jgi:hypothetical protein
MVTRRRIQAHLRGKPHGLVKKEIDKVKLWAEALDLLYQLPRVSGPDTRFDGPCPLVLGPDTRNHGPCTPRTPTVAHYHMGDKTMYENDQSYFARRL